MAQIFISAGHGGFENGRIDLGAVVPGTTESAEMMSLRNKIVAELHSRKFNILSVPDDLSSEQTIAWINARCTFEDVALEIHAGSFNNPQVRGAIAYYIANNEVRRGHGELVMLALLRRLPQLTSRGVKPDTESATGRVAFCRRINCPSLLMEVGLLTNDQDLEIIQTRDREVALGISDGLASWSRAVAGASAQGRLDIPEINISVNGGPYDEKGILINSNAYVPIDLVDQLGVDLSKDTGVRRVNYNNVVYVKAVDLREFHISVGWDPDPPTVKLKSFNALQICPGLIDRIMGQGKTSDTQMKVFLQNQLESGLAKFEDLPKLYRTEAITEGVNHDIAFAQMCVETDFLRFSANLRPAQNNFGGIGSATGGFEGASFPSARIGVRAQIQHLKAYASTEPIVQTIVDPRFRFVRRGIAPLVDQLSGRWNADERYGEKIIAVLKRLYEYAQIF